MHQRQTLKIRPGLERLEDKQLLSSDLLTTHVANLEAGSRALVRHVAESTGASKAASDAAHGDAELKQLARPVPNDAGGLGRTADHARPASSVPRFTIFRITNTAYPLTVNLKPPFQQVLVQSAQPVPGQVYNVLFLSMRNGTAQTFNASSGLEVGLSPNGSRVRALVPDCHGERSNGSRANSWSFTF